MELYPFKKKKKQHQNWRENCMLVIVLHQGTKSLGPSEVAGSSCAEQPGACGGYLKAVSTYIPPRCALLLPRLQR